MNKLSLYFVEPRKISISENEIPEPKSGQVLIQTLVSAISAGTEMLIYRNQFPTDIPLDKTIPMLKNNFKYPLKYGYSVVGKIIACGNNIPAEWKDRLVFTFHPHESHFLASLDELISIPNDISIEDASFLAHVETAVNLVMDGRPIIGEKVAVFGQGIIGLLTTAILARIPLSCLLTFDKFSLRREKSLQIGANYSLDPDKTEIFQKNNIDLDLSYELSGNPAALEYTLKLTGFTGRIVIGSWYGIKNVNLDLSSKFHRDRINIISSQVSTLDPKLQGLWNKARRINLAWNIIRRICPKGFITQKFHISEAEKAYSLIDMNPEKTIQILLTYI